MATIGVLVAGLCFFIGFIKGVNALVRRNFAGEITSTIGWFITGGVVLAITKEDVLSNLSLKLMNLIRRVMELPPIDPKEAPKPEPEAVTPAPSPAAAEPSLEASGHGIVVPANEPLDTSMFTTILPVAFGILGCFVVIVVSVVLIDIMNRKRSERRDDLNYIKNTVKKAIEKIDKVILKSSLYETDLAKQIDLPMMTDVSRPLVSEYIRQMRTAIAVKESLSAKPNLEYATNILNTATELETKFEAAEQWAERNRWSIFTAEENIRLADAKVALKLIEDSSTTPEQRNALYKRIVKSLTGIIVINNKTKLELSHKVPMLTLESSK